MFESMRGSQISIWIRKSTEPLWQPIAHSKMINPLFPSLSFVASFLALLADLTLLTPV